MLISGGMPLSTMSTKKQHKTYELPSWMKKLENPTAECNVSAPSYKEITNIIKRLRSAASPCPYDQINIIMLKRCPFLRTVLHRIISTCWATQNVPKSWKKGFTILIHKKGECSDPSNFRPITLQPVCAKVYSTLIRNRMYTFLLANKFIESNIQKGFWEGVSGTIEHTELLTHMINHARINQKSAIVTMLDLKNAFGEVEHNFIMKVLDYHHVPEQLKSIVREYYDDYVISIGTKDFITNPIVVKKRVLQGDCLSPLLFNMCFNTLLKSIDDERIKCTGYVFSNLMTPRHWFQFADDSSIVTATEKDNQNLLNVFTKWCSWADFTIRIDKCCTFGIKKNGQKSSQFKPYLRISGQMIPCIEMGERFRYLGKYFSFDMSPDKVKEELLLEITNLMGKIDRVLLHPHKKLRIISLYVYSKIRWEFSIYDLSCTWVVQSLDSIIKLYVKRWLHLPQGANFDHITLPSNKTGLEFELPSQVYQYCKVSIRKTLRNSPNEDITLLYSLTKPKNIRYDVHVETENPKKALKKKITNKIENHLNVMKYLRWRQSSLKREGKLGKL